MRHRASQAGQSASAFPLNGSFQSFPTQRRFFRDAGKLLGGAYEIVIQRNRGSHGSPGMDYSIK